MNDEIVKVEALSAGTRSKKEGLSILFIEKGSGTCLRGHEVLHLEENMVYTGVSDCFQQFELVEDTTGYLVAIDPDKLGTKFETETLAYKSLFSIHRLSLRLDAESAEEMSWLMTRIIKKTRSKEKYRTEIIQNYVGLLMLHLRCELQDDLVLAL